MVERPDIQQLMGVEASDGAACHVTHIVHARLHCAESNGLHALNHCGTCQHAA